MHNPLWASTQPECQPQRQRLSRLATEDMTGFTRQQTKVLSASSLWAPIK
jgi:hypothetical protein